MAATNFTPISLYYSTTASAVPSAGNLVAGELALNIADMKLYAKNSSGTVTLLASNASTTGVDSLSFGSTGLTPNTATTGAITVAGTLNVANGGTGATTLTAGRVLFGAGTSAVGNSANLFWDTGNNRLGIGTSTPSGSIDVTGRSYFRASGSNTVLTLFNTSGGDGSITVTGTSNTLNYGFSTFSATDAFYIQNDGNVGIGTTSPANKLDVRGSTNINSTLTISPNTNLKNTFTFTTNASNDGRLFIKSDTTDKVDIQANGSSYFNGGNVGIGTSSPSAKLQIQDTTQIRSVVSASQNVMQFWSDSTPNFAAGIGCSTVAGGLQSAIVFETYVNGGAWTERFRFASAGQLGIGGTNYGTAGQVLTSGGASAAPTWAAAGGGSQAFVAFGSTGGL
jgi:hypothetical protein